MLVLVVIMNYTYSELDSIEAVVIKAKPLRRHNNISQFQCLIKRLTLAVKNVSDERKY